MPTKKKQKSIAKVRKRRVSTPKAESGDDNLMTLAGLGVGGYILYRIIVPPRCTKDITQLCSDGSTIITAKCIDGKLVNTGNICVDTPPVQIISFTIT